MRLIHRLTFKGDKRLENKLSELNIDLDIEENEVTGRSVEAYVYEDDPIWKKVSKLIKKHDVWDLVGTEYSEEDYARAKWFRIETGQFGYPQPVEDFGYLEVTYDLSNYCPTCGIGKIQNNPFQFNSEPKAKHSQFIGLNWVFDEIFIREPVKTKFEEVEIKVEFSQPVFRKSNLPIESVHQLQINETLPDGLITDNLNKITCKYQNEEEVKLSKKWRKPKNAIFCGRVKYHLPQRGPMTFKDGTFDKANDFVKTSEWFGSGYRAYRPILVSNRIRDIYKRETWRGAFFEPVYEESQMPAFVT